jgi:hypothetical protein
MKHYYFWLVSQDEDGKPYLVFGGNTEDEARGKGLEMLGGMDFQIKRYPTKDLSTASSYYRGRRLERTQSLKEAGRRIGHSKSINRKLRRQEWMQD